MRGTLVIVPCGRSKIWKKQPKRGPTAAAYAYTGTPFKLNRRYAETFGDAWVVLSAKHGFVWPDADIPGPYDVTFKQKSTHPITVDELRRQVVARKLDTFERIIGLGGAEYRQAIEGAFAATGIPIHFPFAGLPIGKMMRATKQAIESARAEGQPEAN